MEDQNNLVISYTQPSFLLHSVSSLCASLYSQVSICLSENNLEHVLRKTIDVTEMDETLIFSLSVQEVVAVYWFFSYTEHQVEYK